MKITDEMVKKAYSAALRIQDWDCGIDEIAMHAALQSILPDIEREVREEIASLLEQQAEHDKRVRPRARHLSDLLMAASAIRSLPPSTQEGGE
jgi:hypothetical protein